MLTKVSVGLTRAVMCAVVLWGCHTGKGRNATAAIPTTAVATPTMMGVCGPRPRPPRLRTRAFAGNCRAGALERSGETA